MNILRKLACWWYRRHIPIRLFTPGFRVICTRCGTVLAERLN